MKNPIFTSTMIVKELIDLTEDDAGLVLEAHEKACFAYDMVCAMMGIVAPVTGGD